MGGLVSARRRVANQRDSRDNLPSIVGSNRGHHDKDAGGSESGASQTHHLPGMLCLSQCCNLSLQADPAYGDILCTHTCIVACLIAINTHYMLAPVQSCLLPSAVLGQQL